MGFYINPPNMTKEEWLRDHGAIANMGAIESTPADHHLVCLVDNGWMTAAGIAFDLREAQAFAHPDGRPKTWFLVPDKNLIEVCPPVASVLRPYHAEAKS